MEKLRKFDVKQLNIVNITPELLKDFAHCQKITKKWVKRDNIWELMEISLDNDTQVECVVLLSREKATEQNFNIRIARSDDAEKILSLYQSVKNGAFCVWNDSYPGMLEIKHDTETENQYVMTHDSKIIGAISIVPENELDGFDCWSCKDGKEIARVVISEEYRGKGLSFEIVRFIESVLREDGCKAIHLSVAKVNIPAYKTYVKAGFTTVGEAEMYGNSYYLMEKLLDSNSPPNQITDERVVL